MHGLKTLLKVGYRFQSVDALEDTDRRDRAAPLFNKTTG